MADGNKMDTKNKRHADIFQGERPYPNQAVYQTRYVGWTEHIRISSRITVNINQNEFPLPKSQTISNWTSYDMHKLISRSRITGREHVVEMIQYCTPLRCLMILVITPPLDARHFHTIEMVHNPKTMHVFSNCSSSWMISQQGAIFHPLCTPPQLPQSMISVRTPPSKENELCDNREPRPNGTPLSARWNMSQSS